MEEFKSERFYLRDLTVDDITDEYLGWFQDEKVTSFLEAKNLTKEEVIKYISHGVYTGTYFMYAICDLINDKHIGNVKVGPIDLKHNISDLVVVIGNTKYWGNGVGTEVIKLGNKLAFEKHKIRKLSGGMYSDNIGSIKAYTKAGWIIEATLVGHYQLDDKILDRTVVSCFNPKYFIQDENKNWKVKTTFPKI